MYRSNNNATEGDEQDSAPDQGTAGNVVEQDTTDVETYWTPERMRNAQPVPLPTIPRPLEPADESPPREP